MAEEKTTFDVEGLGQLTLVREPVKAEGDKPSKPGVYSMSDKELMKFREASGIRNPKEVFAAIAESNKQLAEKVHKFVFDKAKETLADYEVHCGSGPDHRVDFVFQSRKESRNVQTGEKTEKFGVFTMKIHNQNPVEQEIYQKAAADIEAAFKSKL